MSIKLGKGKNWGSRSGRKNKVGSTVDPLIDILSELPSDSLKSLASNPSKTSELVEEILLRRSRASSHSNAKLVYETKLGKLYQGDCISFLQAQDDATFDCIFADPPFNLRKDYSEGVTDYLSENEYLEWCRQWLELCADKLKLGGSLFVYNIPKWSMPIAEFLRKKLTFKHWIAVDITFSLPIPGRLYPSHYSLLYFVKGDKPNVFNPPRTPIKTCVRCGQEQNDYGGYKMKMNPKGVNIRDVWTDIPPVRHSKNKNRDANELSLKLLDRVLDISTNEGDLVFDPFGGSGTTYVASELKKRRWVGTELGSCKPIIERFQNLEDERIRLEKIRKDINTLFTDKALKLRMANGLPIDNYRIEESQLDRVASSFQTKFPGIEI